MTVRIDQGVTTGHFELDGGSWEVDNNVWLLGDDDEVLVVDAPHDAEAIAAAVGDRTVVAIACTHAHDDHVRVAPALRERVSAPILLHPADRPMWELTHADHLWDVDLADGTDLAADLRRLLDDPAPTHRDVPPPGLDELGRDYRRAWDRWLG